MWGGRYLWHACCVWYQDIGTYRSLYESKINRTQVKCKEHKSAVAACLSYWRTRKLLPWLEKSEYTWEWSIPKERLLKHALLSTLWAIVSVILRWCTLTLWNLIWSRIHCCSANNFSRRSHDDDVLWVVIGLTGRMFPVYYGGSFKTNLAMSETPVVPVLRCLFPKSRLVLLSLSG